jgi:hypothetical protein
VNRDYFGRPGAMLVAVARRSVHPFQFLFRWREPTGIYRAYTINPPGSAPARYAWAVAAARAGYRDFGRPDGSYNPTVDSWENEREMALPVDELPGWWRRNNGWEGLSPHNLSLSDWDAVLLPLHRAWSTRVPAWQNRGPASGAGAERSPGYWQSRTAAEILDELWSHAEWRPLYLGPRGQGLRTWARGEGPVGMTGSIDYGGMEDKVFH